jgi:predicted SnoaL-like aldol condensation-catalyzing enzyme
MLKSDDPKLARNKKHVFDFWRIVYEGGHLDQAPQCMAETYIQHNPNVPSGRKAFVELFSKQRPPRPVEPRIKMKVISIVAERDIVMVSTASGGGVRDGDLLRVSWRHSENRGQGESGLQPETTRTLGSHARTGHPVVPRKVPTFHAVRGALIKRSRWSYQPTINPTLKGT